MKAAETAAGTTIPVMAQFINYATVRPDAFRQNLLSLQNRQVYDVPGRPSSPYITRFLFAAAPTRQDAPTGDVALMFPQNLYVQLGAPYTIVATSDGSQCGQPQNTPVGVLLSSTSLNHFLPPVGLPYLNNFTLYVDMVAYGLPAYG